MRRNALTALAASLVVAAFAGCGGGDSTTVTQSPEAKKADVQGQDAMREAMQGKKAGPVQK